MNLMFVYHLRHAGLALAIGLGSCINASLLYMALRRQEIFTPQPGWRAFLTKVVVATVLMSAALWLGASWLGQWDQGGMLARSGRLLSVIVAGVVVYFGTLLLAGIRPRDFVRREK